MVLSPFFLAIFGNLFHVIPRGKENTGSSPLLIFWYFWDSLRLLKLRIKDGDVHIIPYLFKFTRGWNEGLYRHNRLFHISPTVELLGIKRFPKNKKSWSALE